MQLRTAFLTADDDGSGELSLREVSPTIPFRANYLSKAAENPSSNLFNSLILSAFFCDL